MRLDNPQVLRDHDGAALQLGEFMRVGSLPPSVNVSLLAEDVFAAGGRLVVFNQTVDLDAPDATDTARFFALLRELTSYGILADWRLRAGHGDPRWRDLWHLFPPSEVVIPPGPGGKTWEFWRQQFYYGLCTMRKGPGIVEVRDRRSAGVRYLRFTAPPFLEAVERLEWGAPAASIAPEVLAELEAARVVMAIGDIRLWLPCRFRRSALSPIVFW